MYSTDLSNFWSSPVPRSKHQRPWWAVVMLTSCQLIYIDYTQYAGVWLNFTAKKCLVEEHPALQNIDTGGSHNPVKFSCTFTQTRGPQLTQIYWKNNKHLYPFTCVDNDANMHMHFYIFGHMFFFDGGPSDLHQVSLSLRKRLCVCVQDPLITALTIASVSPFMSELLYCILRRQIKRQSWNIKKRAEGEREQ